MTPAVRAFALLLLGVLAASCSASNDAPRAVKGQLDLTARDWAAGPVALAGEWAFEEGFRKVPDEWTGNDAGGPDGRGSGTYRLKVNVGDAPPLALRFGSVSTAFLLKVNGVELARGGSPDADAARARSAYAPGTVRLPPGPVLDVEFFVSNHDYRVGGLWTTPVLGPADAVVRGQWFDEVSELTLAIGLGVIGLAALVLFGFRPSEKTFLPFGAFALLIALRSLVTGEYTVVKLLPGLPFDAVVRLEYLTAFLLLPAAAMFFSRLFPGVFGRWPLRAFVGPGLGFTAMALAFPLAWLTRSIPWFYPTALIQLVWGISLLSLRFAKDKQGLLFLVGLSILSVTALADLVAAAVFSFTATWIPWGLGAFIVLQAASMAQRFLAAVEANERLLADKEFLVREIHHRVKNSLQLVASIVTLQANRIEGPMKAVFQSLRRRITAIALVHEKLHGQGLGERSDLGGYLRDLLKLQYPDDELMASGVVWDIDAEQLTAGIDYCIDAGLILTELVGNAYKHALVPRGGGRLQVEIKIRQGRLVIEVADDGAGFPAGFQPEGAKGLGFRLVLTLLQRNDGTLMLPGGPGGRVRVELRLPAPD